MDRITESGLVGAPACHAGGRGKAPRHARHVWFSLDRGMGYQRVPLTGQACARCQPKKIIPNKVRALEQRGHVSGIGGKHHATGHPAQRPAKMPDHHDANRGGQQQLEINLKEMPVNRNG